MPKDYEKMCWDVREQEKRAAILKDEVSRKAVILPKKLATCYGMSNVVYDWNREPVGYLYFWDFDFKDDYGGWSPDAARRIIMWLSVRYGIDLHVFETKHGIHILSFSILNSYEVRCMLADSMQWLPSNYWREHDLMYQRISRKGNDSAAPRWAFAIVPDELPRRLSLGHMQKLVELGVAPNDLVTGRFYQFTLCDLQPTLPLMHVYLSRVR